jgi:hypothetical protein
MQYTGWNFEKTLLVRSPSGPRERELIDVRIPLDGRSARNLERDVRVILKKDWNLLEREIPSHVYGIEHHGAIATCRVAFVMDVPAFQPQRVGVYYDNPDAPAPRYESPLQMSGSPLGGSVNTPFLTAAFDDHSGQIRTLTGRFDVPSIDPLRIPFFDRVQEHVAVLFAVQDGHGNCRAEWASPAAWDKPAISQDIRGPIFVKLVRRGKLAWPGCPAVDQCPDCQIAYKFFAHQPYFLVYTRVTFVARTDVFGIRIGGMSVDRDRYTHYTFRPVSPSLPETDIEEMGHILIDSEHTAGLPNGSVFSGLLPYTIAWHAFLRAKKGMDCGLAAIQLRHTISTPRIDFPYYRSATYLLREPDAVSCTRAPVYTKVQRPENLVRIPAGTVIDHLDAVVCDRFDMDWGNRTERLGKRLNDPPQVAVHPRFMLGDVPPEAYEPLPYGQRGDAYRRFGVR